MPASAASSPGVSVGDLVQLSRQRHGISGVQHDAADRAGQSRPASRSISTGNALPTVTLTNMPNEILTVVTPDYTDSADGVGDTFDASLYALSLLRDGRGHAGHHPQHGRRRRLRLDLGRRSLPPGLFARQRQSRPDQQPRRLYDRRRSADRPARHGGHRRRHRSWRPPPPRRRRQSRHHRARFHRFRDLGAAGPARRTRRWATCSATSPASSISTSPTASSSSPRWSRAASSTAAARCRRRPRSATTAAASPSPPSTSRISIRATAPRASPLSPTPSPTISTRPTSSASRRCRTITARPRAAAPTPRPPGRCWSTRSTSPPAPIISGSTRSRHGAEGGEPGGNIRVGFLYNTDRVQLGDLDANATLAERRKYTDRIGDGVRDAGDLIAFSDDMLGAEINAADWTRHAPLAARRVHLQRQHRLRHRQPLAGQGRLGRILAVQPESRGRRARQ